MAAKLPFNQFDAYQPMKISFTLDVKNAGDIGAFVQQGRILGNDEREEDPREEQQQKKRTEAAAADAKHVKVNVKANHSGGDKGKAPAATSSKKEIGVRNLLLLVLSLFTFFHSSSSNFFFLLLLLLLLELLWRSGGGIESTGSSR